MTTRNPTRRRFSFVVLVGLWLWLGGGWLPHASAQAAGGQSNKETPASPLRVACVGDSITQGVHVRGEDNYPSVLGRMLGDRFQVRNFGFLGGTVMNVNDRPYSACAEFKAATAFNPDLVVFLLGTNDSKPGEWQHKERFKQDLIALLDHFAGLPAKPKIWVCTPAWVAKHHPGGHDEEVLAKEILPLIRAVAAEKKLPLIDIHAALDGKPEMYVDGVHPNAAGCAIIAQVVFKAIAPPKSQPQNPSRMDEDATRSTPTRTPGAGPSASDGPRVAPDARYEARSIAGWTVHVRRDLIGQEPALTNRALELLGKQLDEIVRVVPAPAVAELRKVPLYFSPEYPGIPPRAEFHPSAGWLRDNGRDPAMARCVEFTNVRIFEQELNRMPNFALHELAHAYHNLVLPNGPGNPDVKRAYERARTSGKYDRVECWHGNGQPNTFKRAYAMNNPQEFFAENTEAWFSRNDFFPFNRAELQEHDAETGQLLERLWGVHDPVSARE